MNFGTGDAYKNLLSDCKFREHRKKLYFISGRK